jgi:hypothetical protein
LRLCRNRKNAHRIHTNIHVSVGFEPTIAVFERAKTVEIHISHKITHHARTKHSTQSYTKNKRHVTHNEYNTQKLKLFLKQAVEAYRVVICRELHIVYTVGSYMAVRLSAEWIILKWLYGSLIKNV